jgi:mxaJ protein
MSRAAKSASIAATIVATGVVGVHAVRAAKASEAFRVCADPNNMPFSDSLQRGFENRIASLVAHDLGLPVRYTWWPQRRGFVRNTLRAGDCDVVIGVPAGYNMALTTSPYYQSTYVFVTRRDRGHAIDSFDDPALKHMRIGVHMMGDDYANSPAAVALLRRGLGDHIAGYMIYGDYSKESPPSELIDAVARGAVDVAVAWGPLAGYYAARSRVPLSIRPVTPDIDTPFLPFVFAISMGVRHGDSTRKALLDSEIVRRRPEIESILASYEVPVVGSRR